MPQNPKRTLTHSHKHKKLEQLYFESTLPAFIQQYFQSARHQTQKQHSLGQLQNKLYAICGRNLKRLKFVHIFEQELEKELGVISGELGMEPDCGRILGKYCTISLFLWKIRCERRNRVRSLALLTIGDADLDNQKQRQEQIQQTKEMEEFNKYLWRLRLVLEVALPGSSQTAIIEMLRQIGDAERIPSSFKARIKDMLIFNDFTPVERYMKIIGESEISENSTPTSNNYYNSISIVSPNQINQTPKKQTKQNHPLQTTAEKQQIPTPKHEQQSLVLSAQKRISKNRNYGMGRTLHFSHPLKYKKYNRNQDKVYYVNDREML